MASVGTKVRCAVRYLSICFLGTLVILLSHDIFLFRNGDLVASFFQKNNAEEKTAAKAGVEVVLVMKNQTNVSQGVDTDTTGTRYCDRQELRNGYWSEPDFKVDPPYIPQEQWHRSCYGKEPDRLVNYYQSNWVVKSDCMLPSFSSDSFCSLVSNETIAFYGDSITWQQYESLLGLLGNAAIVTKTPSQTIAEVCTVDHPATLVWSRNNYLAADKVRSDLLLHRPGVVVLNRGIWYQIDHILLHELNSTLKVLEEWYRAHPGTRFLWRTTSPGIPGCFNETEPYNHLDDILHRIQYSEAWYNQSEQRSNFNWWRIPEQNQLVERLLRSSSIPFDFIDTFEMYSTRPDQRISQFDSLEKDCLHQCLPGPPDTSNRILQHWILLHREDFSKK